jgi:hypothetical protein
MPRMANGLTFILSTKVSISENKNKKKTNKAVLCPQKASPLNKPLNTIHKHMLFSCCSKRLASWRLLQPVKHGYCLMCTFPGSPVSYLFSLLHRWKFPRQIHTTDCWWVMDTRQGSMIAKWVADEEHSSKAHVKRGQQSKSSYAISSTKPAASFVTSLLFLGG